MKPSRWAGVAEFTAIRGTQPTPQQRVHARGRTPQTSPLLFSRGSPLAPAQACFFPLVSSGGVCRPNNKHGNQCKPTPAQPEPSHGPAVNPHAQTTTLSDPVRRHDEQPIPHGNAVGDYVQEWYSAFVGGLGDELLFETLLAANYLDLPPLLEICAATIGLRMMSELLRPAPLPVRLGTMDRPRVWSCFWLACLLFEW